MKTDLLKKFFLGIAGAMLVAWGISLSAVNATVSFHYQVTDLGTLGSRITAITIDKLNVVWGGHCPPTFNASLPT